MVSKRFFSSRALNIFELTLSKWEYPKHSHNFFELIFIKEGRGRQRINDSELPYQSGDIFLLTPKDIHEFIIDEKTTFGFIKFTEQLFLEKTAFISDINWRKNIDTVILYSNCIPKNIIEYKADRTALFQLFAIIKNEYKNPTLYSRALLLELFGALLIVLSRNLKSIEKNRLLTKRNSEKERIEDILSYIRQNVLDKEKIKISVIAEMFYMSPNYVGIFVKKHAGISIQKYKIQTRIKIAERLLEQTNLTITEVAQKTGFTDGSHFSKFFKRWVGKKPRDFR